MTHFFEIAGKKLDNLKRNYEEANNHEINELKQQLGLAEQVSRDTIMALENQSLILKKTLEYKLEEKDTLLERTERWLLQLKMNFWMQTGNY